MISDKVGIENARMRVTKWKIVWNDNRKDKNWGRERERDWWYLLQLWAELLRKAKLLQL